MDDMTMANGLKFMEEQGSKAAKDIRREIRDLRTKAELGVSLERAIKAAQEQNKTSEGLRTWQTLITAAAFPVRANGEEEEKDEDDEPRSMSGKRKAAALGITQKAWAYASKRVQMLRDNLPPAEAIKKGMYWFSPRARRSDAASDELMLLMQQFWHTDEVSRATGNSAERDMWKASKSPNADRHPRRQLYEAGGGDAVYAKFLEWADYKSFKSRQGPNFLDPGRTLFLSTRCKCLIPPVMEQCACKIHSQQVLYIEALANVDMSSHRECHCLWCSENDGRRWQETWKHLGSFSDAIACPKVDLRQGDPEDTAGFMGRKPECSAFKCTECGFGGAQGIPTCTRLKASEKMVEWKMFEDVITVPASADGKVKAKKLANQTIPKKGRLCDLWAALKEHSKLYMAHHAIAKWQRHCHGLCLETFQDGDLVIETDFAEKYTHQSKVSMMMPVYPQTMLMVAIVHFSPQTHQGGGRVHVTEMWIFASGDMKHDCDFHLHGLAKIADHYLRGERSAATATARDVGRTPRIHMFTDGCGKQCKGRRNFRFLAQIVPHIGFFVDHHFAATSHFKGCHDGIGGVAKNAMKRREKYGHRIMGAKGVVEFLKSFFLERGGKDEQGMREYFARWSPYRTRKVHVELIGEDDIRRPDLVLEGIEGTRDMYHFAGPNTPSNAVSTQTDKDIELVLKRERGDALSPTENERLTELGEVKVVEAKGTWDGVESEVSKEDKEEVIARKVKKKYRVRTRLASCSCSSCRLLKYEECHVHRMFPTLVPDMADSEVKETMVIVAGVEPEDEEEAQEIKFPPRAKECKVARVTGTQWVVSDHRVAKELWKNCGQEEELLGGL